MQILLLKLMNESKEKWLVLVMGKLVKNDQRSEKSLVVKIHSLVFFSGFLNILDLKREGWK